MPQARRIGRGRSLLPGPRGPADPERQGPWAVQCCAPPRATCISQAPRGLRQGFRAARMDPTAISQGEGYWAQAILAAGPDPSPRDAPHLRGPGLGRRARGLGLAGTTAEPPGAPRGWPRPWVTIKSRPQGRVAAASNQPGASPAVRHAGPPLQRAPLRDWLSGRPLIVGQLIGPLGCPAISGVGGAAES